MLWDHVVSRVADQPEHGGHDSRVPPSFFGFLDAIVGMVHPWVGQNLLNCNEFQSLFVRPTDTLVPNHDDA